MLNLIFSVLLISVDYMFYGLFLSDLVGDSQRTFLFNSEPSIVHYLYFKMAHLLSYYLQ